MYVLLGFVCIILYLAPNYFCLPAVCNLMPAHFSFLDYSQSAGEPFYSRSSLRSFSFKY